MAKGAKKVGNGETNPEFEERKRLKKLAHSKHILTSAPAKDFTPLSPSKTIVKHHGADILKKSQRRNHYLFSFCGLIAPITGGKIGELTNLGSKNPTLYLDFPQGRMKLCGTIVYPNSRYLTLQFSKGGKTVLCEDYFDTMVSAAGPTLEVATKKRAGTLAPGKAVVVPLSSSSPLYSREGVTHVIHVLGPNMNPQRPNYLNGNYDEGCRILQNAYSSLFEGFISIVGEHSTALLQKNKKLNSERSETCNHNDTKQANHFSSDPMLKRECTYEDGSAKKCKAIIDPGDSEVIAGKSEKKIGAAKAWGSWAQALYNIAVHPEKHNDDTFEVTNDVVVLNDAYPKAKKHILVLARLEGLDRLADVCQEHLQLLRTDRTTV